LGSPVCAPARSVLMTGHHTGHTTVLGNFGIGGVVGLAADPGRVPLRDQDTTIAEILKHAGYVTGMTGKWGLGEPGTTGLPNDQGFDEWFGFLNQRRAHNHFADYIWLNREKFEIPENGEGKQRVYTHNLFTQFALDFIDRHSDGEKPFFLYLPYLLPHDAYVIPAINPLYEEKDWSTDEKVHASMVSLIDEDVEKIRSLLGEKGIEEKTLLIFTSDNGAAEH
jgi:arylsulfatase A-like enzyme